MTSQDKSRRPRDALTRKPFERLPVWLSLLARIPFPAWYAISSVLAWLGEHVVRHRRQVVESQIRRCFPEFDDAMVGRVRHGFYVNFTDVAVESIKALTIEADELDRRVEVRGFDTVRDHLRAGRSVIFATSHNFNWEWTLQALSKNLGFPLDAAYKPLHTEWADRMFLSLRSRFGAGMIPDRRLLIHVLRRRQQPRAIAMVADQDPVLSAARHVTRFFGLETTFYMGPEALARAAKCPIFYVSVARTSRGHYRVTLEPLVGHDEDLPEGAMIDRYAQRVEAQIRANPSDWLWAYRRWKDRRRRALASGESRAQT
jgi:KDO2-lipid IV(A) lauroyltransferase